MHATTIFSENFDELTPQLSVMTAGQFATTGGTNIDILGPGNFGGECLSPESVNCVDLAGTGGLSEATITSTSISIPSAGTYYLSFDLVGNSYFGPTVTEVILTGTSAGTVYDQVFTLPQFDTTAGIVFQAPVTFAGADTATLTFIDETAGDLQDGGILDNVQLTDALATPEPATSLFLGSGLLVASLLRKRIVR